jgi:L-alanine-DL-glutamate epimerase-like enolase superfamily enzyme
MDIVSAEVHELQIPLNKPVSSSYSSGSDEIFDTMTSSLVILQTRDGARGIGTADAVPNYSLQDHEEIRQSLTEKLFPAINDYQPQNPNELKRIFRSFDGHMNAKCGLEMAFLDLYCRLRGQSIADLFGGSLNKKERLNAWVGTGTPMDMANQAKEYQNQGFNSLKIKFNGDGENDIKRYFAILEAVGEEMQIRADVNTGYDVETALNVAQELEDYPLTHLEQPVPIEQLEGLKEITESSSLAIMADECVKSTQDVYKILSEEMADRVKLKTLRLGGLMNTSMALDVAQVAGASCVVGHGFCLSPAASAELQLISTSENVLRPAETVGPLKMADEPFEPRLLDENGAVTLPSGPGLGVRLIDNRLSDFSKRSEIVNCD